MTPIISLLLAFAGIQDTSLSWLIATEGLGAPTVNAVPIPRRTLLKKGQVVRLNGRLHASGRPSEELSGLVYIRVGSDTRQQIQAKGDWNYQWDTSKELGSNAKLTISYRTAGDAAPQLIKTCDVSFEDSIPAGLATTPNVDGTVSLKMTLGQGLSMDKPKVYVDGSEVAIFFNSDGTATLSKADLASPYPQATVQVMGAVSRNGNNLGVVSAPGAMVEAVQELALDEEAVDLTHPDDPFDSLIILPFKTEAAIKADSVRAFVDGQPARGTPSAGMFQLDPRDIDPTKNSEVWLGAETAKGKKTFSKKVLADDLKLRGIRAKLEELLDRERKRLRSVFALGFKDRLNDAIRIGVGNKLPGGNEYPFDRQVTFIVATRKTVPIFAQQDPQGRSQWAANFPKFWKEKLGTGSLITDFEDRVNSTDWARQCSFIGPHHAKMVQALIAAVNDWLKMATRLEEARLATIRSSSYEDLEEFTRRLNEYEFARLNANRRLSEMEFELGLPVRKIVARRWIIGPRSQEDTAEETARDATGYRWWSQDLPVEMYP